MEFYAWPYQRLPSFIPLGIVAGEAGDEITTKDLLENIFRKF